MADAVTANTQTQHLCEPTDAPGAVTLSQEHHQVTFQVGDEEMDFRVPEKLYVELEEGMQGVLTYRGERLLRFTLGLLRTRPAAAPGETPAMRDEAAPWTPGSRIARKP